MNKDLLIKGMIFLAGGAIGSVVTWKLVKTKYEQIADEEIESMREYYSNRNEDKENNENNDSKETDGLSIKEIRKKVQELGEINKKVMREKEKEVEDDMGRPEVIPPEESWERDYPTLSLTWYEADGILADDADKIVGNIDELVGEDFTDHFGEYEEDSVFIRNDKLEVYYEILRDYGSYAEHMGID